ncbi:MAG: prephenate dehydratase [Chloroflexota bacterium]
MTIVAYQGAPGAFSEEAIYQYYGDDDVQPLPCNTFEHLFEAVDQGNAKFGAVPVENSTAGSINKSYDLLLEHDLKVHGEVLVRVKYCLMTIPGNGKEITEIRAHPQSLAQTEGYLNKHRYVAVPWYDSAGAAKELVDKPEKGVGIVASPRVAKAYGLEIVDDGIEDFHNNFTRFFVVGKGDPEKQEPSKTSLVFAVPEIPGALYEAIGQFASRDINLTKIESRPRKGRLWQYIFYLDFDGHYTEPKASEALIGLLNKASFVKLLGSYPAAPKETNGKSMAQAANLQI